MRTTSASGVIKSEVTQEDSNIDFNKVLQDLTKYQEELTLTLSDKVNDERKKPQDTPVIQISPENVQVHVMFRIIFDSPCKHIIHDLILVLEPF